MDQFLNGVQSPTAAKAPLQEKLYQTSAAHPAPAGSRQSRPDPKPSSAQRPSPPSPLPHALPSPGRGAPPPEGSQRQAPWEVPPLPGGCECVWERGLGGEGPQSAGYEDFDGTLPGTARGLTSPLM